MSKKIKENLFDFDNTEPLMLRESGRPVPNREINEFIGYEVLTSNRDRKCIVCEREYKDHYYQKGEGYAFAESSLEELSSKGVNRIVVEVVDKGRVLEYDVQQYEQGDRVHEGNYDLQRCVPVANAIHEWDRDEVTIIKASEQ